MPDEPELEVPELDAVNTPGSTEVPAENPSEESPPFPELADPGGADGSDESGGPALNGPMLRGAQSMSPHGPAGGGGAAMVTTVPVKTATAIVADQPSMAVVFMRNPCKTAGNPISHHPSVGGPRSHAPEITPQ